MIIALLAVLSLSSTGPTACAPPANFEQLWASEQTRFVFLGERHGTTEAPRAFTEIVCAAALDRPVTVALELPSFLQPALDAYIVSDGGEKARAELLADDFWSRFKDGRGSVAMIEMMERVRALRAEGRDIVFSAFQPGNPNRPVEFGQPYYELEMAEMLSLAAQQRPQSLVLVLVGGLHAAKTRIPDLENSLAAAGHLPPADVISIILARQGGESWACRQASNAGVDPICGPGSDGEAMDRTRRGVIIEPYSDGAFDGLLAVGPSTASPPFKP